MATIRKRTLPSGKTCWLAGYVDGGGKRRFKQFPTRKEADAFLTQARAQVAQGTHTPDSVSPTVAEAAELWMQRCERDKLEATTLRQYRAHVRLHIVPFIGAMKLSRITAPAVNAFVDQLLKHREPRSPEMCRRVLVSLSAIVTEAQRRGLVTVNNVRSASPVKRSKRDDARPERSCPLAWCSSLRATTVTGMGRDDQAARIGRLTRGSSPIGAMLSRVM